MTMTSAERHTSTGRASARGATEPQSSDQPTVQPVQPELPVQATARCQSERVLGWQPVPQRDDRGFGGSGTRRGSLRDLGFSIGQGRSRRSLDDELLMGDAARGEDELLRHETLDFLCDRLHWMLLADTVAPLLSDLDALPAEGVVWCAPTWSWVHSRINVGRKSRDRASGRELAFPVRVAFNRDPVAVFDAADLEPDGIEISWSATGLGHTGAGSVTLIGDPSRFDAELPPSGLQAGESTDAWGFPDRVGAPVLSRHAIIELLQRIAEEGKQSKWEVLSYFDDHVRDALAKAHSSVATELTAHLGEPRALIDETKLDSIATHMLLGDEEHPGYIQPLVERCLKPGFFLNVEPLKYLRDSIRRDANQAIRRAIGDPHIGPKVRKLAAELGTRDIERVVAAYKERWPRDRLSNDRAEAALSVESDAMASWWSLYPGGASAVDESADFTTDFTTDFATGVGFDGLYEERG